MTFDPNNPTASGMVLTFDDEFDTASISSDNVANKTLWTNHGINPGSTGGIENPVPSALSVNNGALDITATNNNGSWTSGMLQTVNSSVQGFTQKYGYFEADIKIPSGDGAGPAFWLYSANHFTNGAPASELDVFEGNGQNPAMWAGTVHDGFGNQNGNNVQNAGIDLSQGYHRVGLLWDPNSPDLTWYVDGKAVMTAPKYGDTDSSPMMMVLQLGIGGAAGAPDGSTPQTLQMYADYVRVYQFASENPTAVQPEAVSPAAGNTDPVALVNALGQPASPSPSPSPSPAPAPAPTPSPTPSPSSDTPVIAHQDAQPTPHEARDFMVPDHNGTATGISHPTVILATGSHQTLIGNGGDDIFELRGTSNVSVVENGHGVSTVMTSAPSYTLPTGISDLTGTTSGAQTLHGNDGNNYIVGGNGADVINAGAGNDTIVVGTGANTLTGGAGQDLFVFGNAADQGNVITDFKVGQDELDLTGLMKSINYRGQDPMADHVLHLVQSGNGTAVVVDPHGTGGAGEHTVVTLENVLPSALKAGHDFIWHA